MHILDSTRRGFMKKLGGISTGILAAATGSSGNPIPGRPSGARYMGDFPARKLTRVRCAFIGVGSRGSGHASQLAAIEGTEVVAICDLYEDLAEKAKSACLEAGQGNRHGNIKLYHGSEIAWELMLREVRPDAVFISTPWEDHATMAVECMLQGAHAFVEVPLALTIEELWKLVDTSEYTGRHCMMMENVNYGRTELAYLNACRKGLIGELLHGEAAYIHELRRQMDQEERGCGSWRTAHYAKRNGNLYPTHGLGPVAQYMNLARSEDTFSRLVSLSSPAKGRAAYATANYPKDHKWNKLNFTGGDINTSILHTALGRTILVQWDETTPRPYTRLNLIQGTKGVLAGFPDRVALEGGVPGITEDHHEWAEGDKLEAFLQKYEHPLYKRLGALAEKMGGHGGMDFIMRYRIIECLRNGVPMDQNVYEGCFWSAVAPLSEVSVARGGYPQEFPDFTRGDWQQTQPLAIVD